MIKKRTTIRVKARIFLFALAIFFGFSILKSPAQAEQLWLITEPKTEIYEWCDECWVTESKDQLRPKTMPRYVSNYYHIQVEPMLNTKYLRLKESPLKDGKHYGVDPRHRYSHVLNGRENDQCLKNGFKISIKAIKRILECRDLLRLEEIINDTVKKHRIDDPDLGNRLKRANIRRLNKDYKDYKSHILAAKRIIDRINLPPNPKAHMKPAAGTGKENQKVKILTSPLTPDAGTRKEKRRSKRTAGSTAKQSKKGKPKTTNNALKRMGTNIKSQSKNINYLTAENKKLSRQLASQNSKIKALEQTAGQLKKLSKSSARQQKKLAENNLAAINKKLAAIDKKLGKYDGKFKYTDKNNDTILNSFAEWQDVIPRLQRKIKNTASANDTILNSFAEWQDVIPRLQRKIKTLEAQLKAGGDSISPGKTGDKQQAGGVEKPKAAPASSADTQEASKNNKKDKSYWQLLGIIGGVLVAGISGAGLVILWNKRSAAKKEEQMFLQQPRGRRREQHKYSDKTEFPDNSRTERSRADYGLSDPIQPEDGLLPALENDEIADEKLDLISLYRSCLTNPAAIDTLKRWGVIGLTRSTSNANDSQVTLIRTDSGENRRF